MAIIQKLEFLDILRRGERENNDKSSFKQGELEAQYQARVAYL